jgi:hypothetical protein
MRREAKHSPHPVPRLRMSGAITSLGLHGLHRDNFNVTLPLQQVNEVRQHKTQAADAIIPEPSAFKFEIDSEK